MVLILAIVAFIYLILISSFCIGFSKVKHFKYESSIIKTKFSILIPFRNEANNLVALIQSLQQLDYPTDLFEVILIDDHSEDDSIAIIQQNINVLSFNVKIIKNINDSKSPKKDAITLAIKQSLFDWIVTTDADCVAPKSWLKTMDAFIQKQQPKMIVAPLSYTVSKSFFDHFQLLDFLSLQSATIGGFGLKRPFLCNGANFAYQKDFFTKLNGFEGNKHIASGDDIFLLEKALKYDLISVKYLKSADVIVYTKPQPSLRELVQQRVRWASKTSSYNNIFGKLVGFIVLLMNASIIVGLVLSLVGIIEFKYAAIIFTLKLIIDFWCIYKSSKFFNQARHLSAYIISSLLYPFFSVFIAIYAVFFGYKWKQRQFRK